MPAYFIADLKIEDLPGLPHYIQEVPATIQISASRCRGGARRGQLAVFPSLARAKAWYESEEYKPLKKERQKASRANISLVDGAAG